MNRFFSGVGLAVVAGILGGCTELQLGTHFAKKAMYEEAPYEAPSVTGPRKVGKPYAIEGMWYYPLAQSDGYREKGIASWYGDEFHGKPTANGEIFNKHKLTAAHPTLPLPTYVRVTNLENGRSVMVRVNDRGPFLRGRLIDLSHEAARVLEFDLKGTAPVLVEALPTDGSTLLPAIAESGQTVPGPRGKKPVFTQRVADPEVAVKPAVAVEELEPAPAPKIPERKALVRAHVLIYVQTGAFLSRDKAEQQQKEVRQIYNEVNLYSSQKNDQMFYRVRLGPLPTVDSADQALARLVHEGFKHAIIVVE
jgi:rare lipoprotein A